MLKLLGSTAAFANAALRSVTTNCGSSSGAETLLRTTAACTAGAVVCTQPGVRTIRTKSEYFRRTGFHYNDFYRGGLLPRLDLKDHVNLPMPEFKKVDRWNERRATAGQNDYIDILGSGGAVHPVELIRGPRWLVGFRGNELQRLVRQFKFNAGELRAKDQEKFHEMNKRIKYLYWRYNFKFGGIKK